ncbi:MAG: hypothetical protein OJF49_001295 [Ktedonobacterales bacterium]|nr:MAG: hypothetical protein OJF49_001295 [Ktedonobacterales bacterium]
MARNQANRGSAARSNARNTGNTGSANNAHDAARRAALRRLQMLRTGVTVFAMLAGLACYALLSQVTGNEALAVVAGLVFAVLVRISAGSLLRDALVRTVRERQAGDRTPQQQSKE